jgi:hypothetical protein
MKSFKCYLVFLHSKFKSFFCTYEGVGPPKKSKDPPHPFPPRKPQEKHFFTLFTRITQSNVPRVSGGIRTWVGAGWCVIMAGKGAGGGLGGGG